MSDIKEAFKNINGKGEKDNLIGIWSMNDQFNKLVKKMENTLIQHTGIDNIHLVGETKKALIGDDRLIYAEGEDFWWYALVNGGYSEFSLKEDGRDLFDTGVGTTFHFENFDGDEELGVGPVFLCSVHQDDERLGDIQTLNLKGYTRDTEGVNHV